MPEFSNFNSSGVGLSPTELPPVSQSAEHAEHPPTISDQPVSVALQQPNKRRRPSKSKMPGEIRRSSSTPHMRNLALAHSGELSPTTDKRRNKLGYHRTSVACGHCRRRKIRCLVANDDPQGRCANCIRLKKDCNFYPVEQTPENQRSQASTLKESASGAPSSSTTSSPRHPPSGSGEKMEEFRTPSFAGPSSQTTTPRFGMHADVEVDPHQSPVASGYAQHPPYAYPPPIETQWPTPGYLPSSTVADTPASSSGMWRPSPSGPNSAYGNGSNASTNQTPATMSSSSSMSYGRPGDSHNWHQPNIAPPARSMSYGNIEGLPQQYPNAGLGIQHHQDYPRRTSPYPYPIDTNSSSIHTSSLGGTAAAPLSAPILPNQQYGYPQVWNPYGNVQPPANDMQGRSMSVQWYNEPGRLDRVQEENAQPVLYSQHPTQQYYSGS